MYLQVEQKVYIGKGSWKRKLDSPIKEAKFSWGNENSLKPSEQRHDVMKIVLCALTDTIQEKWSLGWRDSGCSSPDRDGEGARFREKRKDGDGDMKGHESKTPAFK